jgi:RNA polymerase sigma factor (sigma-70 family)
MGRILDSRGDRELLVASRTGDGGFDVFYRRHCAALLAFHARRAREPELAADLTAETFAAALIAVRDQSRKLPENPVAWLFTIAHRKFVDSYRHGRVEDKARRRLAFERMEISDDAAERIVETVASTDVIAYLARHLPADQFEALRARIIDDRDYSDIANELRCSESLVRLRVSRALKTLRATVPQDLREAHDG